MRILAIAGAGIALAAAAQAQSQAGCGIPNETDFSKTTLMTGLDEPMQVEFAPDGRIFVIEKVTGQVLIRKPETGATVVAATLNVSTEGNHADGLLGLALDPGFASNRRLYLYYSPVGPTAINRLSRFTVTGDKLDMASERKLLEIPTQRTHCCHSAGGLEFGPGGNLYLSTGDNSLVTSSILNIEAEATASNSNDLRGKIIRIHPEPAGDYTIPAGNLFATGVPKTRPEIYTMGHRNPFRFAVDMKTGAILAGEVGPDGPDDFDELNFMQSAGNQGWPYFVGATAYPVNGKPNSPDAPMNLSDRNTGLQNLPPARPPALAYKYSGTDRFPGFNKGGRVACGGPIYHYDPASPSKIRLPPWFDGKWLIYDWRQRWIRLVAISPQGEFTSVTDLFSKLIGTEGISRISDMKIGPDGAIYVVQYGWLPYAASTTGALFRIEYNPPKPECLPGPSLSLAAGRAERGYDPLLGGALRGKRFDLIGRRRLQR